MRPLRMALLAILVLGCEGRQPIGEGSIGDDPWLAPMPGSFAGWARVTPDVEPVWPAERFGTIQRLQTQPWLAISETEAKRLTGESPKPGKAPYLLRGLCIRCGKGSFMLLQRSTELALHHASAPILQTLPTRWPVVAWLDRAPTQLYLSCDASGSRPAATAQGTKR